MTEIHLRAQGQVAFNQERSELPPPEEENSMKLYLEKAGKKDTGIARSANISQCFLSRIRLHLNN